MNIGSYSPVIDKHESSERNRLNQQANVADKEEMEFLRSIGLRPGIRVLDLGCGCGSVTYRLAAEAAGGTVIGADADTRILPKNIEGSEPKFIVAKAGALPFQPESFDFIYARFLLQHVPNPSEIVNDAASKLASGGSLALMDTDDSFFTMDPLDAELDDLLSNAREIQTKLSGDRYIGRKLPCLITSAGLTISACKARVFTSLELPFEMIFRLATGYKAALLDKQQEFADIMKRLLPEFISGRAFMTSGVLVVGGKKK